MSSKLTEEEAEVLNLIPREDDFALFSWPGRKGRAENDRTQDRQRNVAMTKVRICSDGWSDVVMTRHPAGRSSTKYALSFVEGTSSPCKQCA